MATSDERPAVRIFSYRPNPRVWKATIPARLGSVEIDWRGARPAELSAWLWDVDPRPLTVAELERAEQPGREVQARKGFGGALRKTEAFLRANPCGTVPVALNPEGTIGVFESNSMGRLVARLGNAALYGDDPWQASQIDSFLDASLVLGVRSQDYLLASMRGAVDGSLQTTVREALESYFETIERALASGPFLVGGRLSLADVVFVAELAMVLQDGFHRERLQAAGLQPLRDELAAERRPALEHWRRLVREPAFAEDLEKFRQRLDLG